MAFNDTIAWFLFETLAYKFVEFHDNPPIKISLYISKNTPINIAFTGRFVKIKKIVIFFSVREIIEMKFIS